MVQQSRSHEQHQQTAFRKAEKKYKRLVQPADLSDVVDFSAIDGSPDKTAGVSRIYLTEDLATPPSLPFEAYRQKRPPAYVLDNHPGLVVIPDALTNEAQRWLARKCLCDCTRPPNRTNLNPFFELPAEPLFALAFPRSATYGQSSAPDCSLMDPEDCAVPGRLKTIRSRAETNSVHAEVTVPKAKFYTQSESPMGLLDRLRWCTLGQQYNWTTKEYDLGTCAFDSDLDSVMKSIAETITQPAVSDNQMQLLASGCEKSAFVSQAGIINYYDQGATMAGHVDKTEENMDAPLISMCIGLSCIYLVGGLTRDTEPTALILRSGDVLAMCGASRLAFHGVPKVLPGTSPAYLAKPAAGINDVGAEGYPEWQHFAAYLETHRINCNARKCS
ncbi:hypothetical protein LPJ66_000350 [Kickxella alabastrina]|uniref:Uncharacterized protein n=1 Tax=Kickxella alabastrina TaxID=61397 RepID=A0ACC1IWH4_9FUNG|nr:hypothetical protein LPJ66_000350 [Kickxella alabastrina]